MHPIDRNWDTKHGTAVAGVKMLIGAVLRDDGRFGPGDAGCLSDRSFSHVVDGDSYE